MTLNQLASSLILRFAVVACWIAVAAPAFAQGQYKQGTADKKLDKWVMIKTAKEEWRSIDHMLKGSASLDDGEFSRFFNQVVFPQFTLAENIFATSTAKGAKNTVCRLPEMRKDFRTLFLQPATNRQAIDRLNQLTLESMRAIANDNYHPIARYNAMLLIADLNEDEGTETPYKLALVDLVKAVLNPNTIDAVRVAALVGIVRHAKAGIDPAWQGHMAKYMGDIVSQSKAPAGRSPEGHDWMRRRALQALIAMYTKAEPPADGQFTQLLSAVLEEKDSAMELRAEAAEALLTVKIIPPPKFDSAKMAAGIGQVAVDAYRQELATRDQFGRKLSSDGMKFYFTLVEKALEKLDAAATAPKIKEIQTALVDLKENATAEEEPDPLEPADPLKEEKQYDKVADSGAKFESLVTGKPISEILPKRAPVGGNAQVGVAPARGYGGRPSTDRGGYRGPPARGGYGAGR
jgi:hypothetical protein